MLIYDIEIINAIANKKTDRIDGINYCDGWHDHAGMGISVIGAYDYEEGRYRVFCADNFRDFARLVDHHDTVIGFNNISFDNPVIDAAGIHSILAAKSYDLLIEIWKGAGLGSKFKYPSHIGFGLDACCHVNFGTRKSGHGAMAPVEWQRGNIGGVIDYCINDVKLTKQLFDLVSERGEILDPRNAENIISVELP